MPPRQHFRAAYRIIRNARGGFAHSAETTPRFDAPIPQQFFSAAIHAAWPTTLCAPAGKLGYPDGIQAALANGMHRSTRLSYVRTLSDARRNGEAA